MFERELAATAAAMVAPGKGILAIDESGGTRKGQPASVAAAQKALFSPRENEQRSLFWPL